MCLSIWTNSYSYGHYCGCHGSGDVWFVQLIAWCRHTRKETAITDPLCGEADWSEASPHSKVTGMLIYSWFNTWLKAYNKENIKIHIDGFAQDCSNSSGLAMELLQSCAKPSPWLTNSVLMIPACWFHPTDALLWHHNGHDGISYHQPHDCLLNRLFRRRSKKTSKLRVTGLCAGNSPGTGEFPTQMASNVENVSIWWRNHVDH